MLQALYVHIPFCLRRCSYCDFYIVPMGKGPVAKRISGNHSPTQTRFLDALEQEYKSLQWAQPPNILYFGGGTPTELSLDDFSRLMTMTRELVLKGQQPIEWTVEANPGTLTLEKIRVMAAAGVNRVSLGAQSFQDRILEFLGRFHRAHDIQEAVKMLRGEGLENFSLDHIFSVPNTTVEDTQADLEAMLELQPEHISCYSLELEPGSDLSLLLRKGFLEELPDETSEAQYRLIRKTLNDAGLSQYEISNFARVGRQSRYNEICWSGGEYLGCGPAACSHVAGERWENIPSLHAYSARLLAGRSAIHYREKLEAEPRARELLVTGLRRVAGWNLKAFCQVTGFDALELGGEALREQIESGSVILEKNTLRLTPEALFVSDGIFAELV